MNYYIPRVANGTVALKNAIWHFQQTPCPHCQHSKTLKSHGPLVGTNKQTKGFRLFCSNRNSNRGCGKTFTVFFEDVISGTKLLTDDISTLFRRFYNVDESKESSSVEEAAIGICSRATAYRWRNKLQFAQPHLRSLTSVLKSPPRIDEGSLKKTWTHLESAFSQAKSILGGFQLIFQRPAFQREPKRQLPNSHRATQSQTFQRTVTTNNETPSRQPYLTETQNLTIPLKI